MKDILKQLYYGEIVPDEQLDIVDDEFKDITAEYYKAASKFCNSLKKKKKEEFEQLDNLRDDHDREYDFLNFKKGFQLGMQLTLAGLEIPHIKPTT